MGANIRTRPSVFEEALDIVRRLLAGETVSSSRRFRIVEASLALRPAEPVEVWIGASAPPAIDRAARLAAFEWTAGLAGGGLNTLYGADPHAVQFGGFADADTGGERGADLGDDPGVGLRPAERLSRSAAVLSGPVDASLCSGADHGPRATSTRRIVEPQHAAAGLVMLCFAPDYQEVL
jgi:alkanesulfonate monooxygenase SsuD/methylene tetrahydromethanopterin reductase-like flavin-dependent oxidoreductase (luciferase family)